MIRHPYNFVPLANEVEREQPGSRERYEAGRHSGTLVCTLRTLTPLSIREHFEKLKNKGEAPWIPGSSLRGMVRNVMEMLGAGCGRLFEHDKKRQIRLGNRTVRWRPQEPPDLGGLALCSGPEVCMVCRLFGYTPAGEENGEERVSGWMGKLAVHDSRPAEGWNRTMWLDVPVGLVRPQSHGPRHEAFYYPDAANPRRPAGWKVYLHAKEISAPDPHFRLEACVPERTKFRFEVDYENLSDEEFSVLEFALTLRHQCNDHDVNGLAHKLGYGKPLGLGSCEITIDEVRRLNAKRYFGEDAAAAAAPGCKLGKYVKGPGFKKFKEFLNWKDRAERLEYPDYGWFQNPETREMGIAEFEKRKNRGAGGGGNPVRVAPAMGQTAPGPGIPKTVEVKVTQVSARGKVGFETVEEYGGRRYTGVAANTLTGVKAGDVCMLKVSSRDHRQGRLEGRIAWS